MCVVVVVVEKKVLSHPTMGGIILRLGTLPEPLESENTTSTSLTVPGIWASQPGNLSAIAPSAP